MSTEGAVCRPNISAAGRKARRRFGIILVVISFALGAGLVLARVSWPLRALIGLPVAMAAISLLQVSRNTCIARAAEGTIEADDFSKTPAEASDVAASRRVARTIYRDALLLGVAGAALGIATTLVW